MDALTFLVFAAVLSTLAALASGIASMAYDREVGHRNSAEWMGWRVGFQAAAFLFILMAIFSAG